MFLRPIGTPGTAEDRSLLLATNAYVLQEPDRPQSKGRQENCFPRYRMCFFEGSASKLGEATFQRPTARVAVEIRIWQYLVSG